MDLHTLVYLGLGACVVAGLFRYLRDEEAGHELTRRVLQGMLEEERRKRRELEERIKDDNS